MVQDLSIKIFYLTSASHFFPLAFQVWNTVRKCISSNKGLLWLKWFRSIQLPFFFFLFLLNGCYAYFTLRDHDFTLALHRLGNLRQTKSSLITFFCRHSQNSQALTLSPFCQRKSNSLALHKNSWQCRLSCGFKVATGAYRVLLCMFLCYTPYVNVHLFTSSFRYVTQNWLLWIVFGFLSLFNMVSVN